MSPNRETFTSHFLLKTPLKPLVFILLVLFDVELYAQEPVRIENGQDYSVQSVPPFLHALYNKNVHIISFRVKFSDQDERSDYFILTRKGSNLSAFNYTEKSHHLESLKLSDKSLELAWNTFIQNGLFSMQNEKDIPNFCLEKYQIYNSHTYEFVVLNNGTMKKLLYYDPEYYDIACYGMVERQKIINIVSVINHVLRR